MEEQRRSPIRKKKLKISLQCYDYKKNSIQINLNSANRYINNLKGFISLKILHKTIEKKTIQWGSLDFISRGREEELINSSRKNQHNNHNNNSSNSNNRGNLKW